MMIFQKILLKSLTKLVNNFIKNCKCRSVFSKSLRLTSLLAILRNDFQSNVLNIEYHTKFIQVREFLLPEKGEGPPFSSLRVSTVHLHKTMTQQSGTFQNRNSEPFMGTLFDTYLFTLLSKCSILESSLGCSTRTLSYLYQNYEKKSKKKFSLSVQTLLDLTSF